MFICHAGPALSIVHDQPHEELAEHPVQDQDYAQTGFHHAEQDQQFMAQAEQYMHNTDRFSRAVGGFMRQGTAEGQSRAAAGHLMVDTEEADQTQEAGMRFPPLTRDELIHIVRNMKIGDEAGTLNALTEDQRNQVFDLLLSVPEVFPGNVKAPEAMKSGYEITSNTGDAPPVKVSNKGRKLPHCTLVELADTIRFWLERGIIVPSQSPWCAPVVVARKKDGSLRLCIDYRKLNAVTKKDAYQLPNVNDILQSLHGAMWFSSFDLASGYHQLELSPRSKEKTAFSPPWGGLFHFNRAPFGLTSLPGQFSRLMAAVLHKAIGSYAQVFLDDVLVFSTTFEEHLGHTKSVLQALKGAGLKIAHHKCELFKSKLKYIGELVSRA